MDDLFGPAHLLLLCGLLFGASAFAQSGAVIPQGGAGHAAKASCVILKRMGPADQVTSHMYSFGMRGKQFDYVEGKLPEGLPFHGRMTDHDVRNLQARGAEVIVLDSHYTSEDLKQARADCAGETGTTPNQSEAKVTAPDKTSTTAQVAGSANPANSNVAAQAMSELSLSSHPTGAEITVDGNFVGDTPSSLSLPAGDHLISISLDGYHTWQRKMHTTGGKITLSAPLVKTAMSQSAAAQNPKQ